MGGSRQSSIQCNGGIGPIDVALDILLPTDLECVIAPNPSQVGIKGRLFFVVQGLNVLPQVLQAAVQRIQVACDVRERAVDEETLQANRRRIEIQYWRLIAESCFKEARTQVQEDSRRNRSIIVQAYCVVRYERTAIRAYRQRQAIRAAQGGRDLALGVDSRPGERQPVFRRQVVVELNRRNGRIAAAVNVWPRSY